MDEESPSHGDDQHQKRRCIWSIWPSRWSKTSVYRGRVIVVGLIVTLLVVNYILIRRSDFEFLSFKFVTQKESPGLPPPEADHNSSAPRDYSREAYVTLLSPGDPHPWAEGKVDYYFESVKVKAHSLLRNETVRDPHGRPFVVLVTPNVPRKQIEILRFHGAIVKEVPILPPPSGTVDFNRINPRYKDQFTKLHVWNMTEYTRVAFLDADTLVIRPINTIFDTPTRWSGDEEWLFAAVYDSGESRNGNRRNPPGPDDIGRPQDKDINAGVFLLYPTQQQSQYIFDLFANPTPKLDFTIFMEQDFLRWAYRDNGPYPWIRLSHLFNTQWCRSDDLDSAYLLHDKLWGGGRGVEDELRRMWYQAWGEMVGWDASRHFEGIQRWREEEVKIGAELAEDLKE